MQPMNREIVLKSFLENKERIDRYTKEGIEKYRKGDFTLKFKTGGKKKVKITHKKHSFLFGSTAFMLDSFEKEGRRRNTSACLPGFSTRRWCLCIGRTLSPRRESPASRVTA